MRRDLLRLDRMQLQYPTGLSYSALRAKFVDFGKSTNFRWCEVLERSPRSEGVRTSYLARVGFRDDIFEKSFLGVFHVRFLICGGRADLGFGENLKNPPNFGFFVAPDQFFHQIDGNFSKIENSCDGSVNNYMNPKRAKYEVHRCTDEGSNPGQSSLGNFVDFPMVYKGNLTKSTEFEQN